MSTKSEKAPAPPEVEKVLKALEPYTVSEEGLYLHYSRLAAWKLADLAKFFGQEEYWRLFRCVCRRLGLTKIKNQKAKIKSAEQDSTTLILDL